MNIVNSTQNKSAHAPKGFTLIELLTVIAIIGILAAIIIPTVGKVRRTALESQATSNIRQTAMALITSASEYKGNIIPGTLEAVLAFGAGNNPRTTQKWNWFDLLERNMGRKTENRLDINVNPVSNFSIKDVPAGIAPGSGWAPNPYVMPEEGLMIDLLRSDRLTLGNAPISRVMLLTSSVNNPAWFGAPQTAYLLFWGGPREMFTGQTRVDRLIPARHEAVNNDKEGFPNGNLGGISFDIGGDNHTAAIFAYMDGHVERIKKGAIFYGHIYTRNR